MQLRQLACLVSVAEEASFTRAGARLHLAQPGVSAQVRRLERELGQELLDRSDRRVRPTEAGAAVLPYARAALEAAADIRRVVDERTGLIRGRVTVGMVAACTSVELPRALEEFHATHPGVEISLSEANSDQMIEHLRAGQLDLALIGTTGNVPAELQTQVVADEPLVAAVATGHPLYGRATITLANLVQHPLISLPQGTGLRAALDHACLAAGLHPHVAFEASSPNVLVQLAGHGLGVAILAHSIAATRPDQIASIAIVRPGVRARLALSWNARRPVSPAAAALIAHARRSFASQTCASST